jgi:deoxyadenosine/deoxycytidine kinase
MSEKKNILIDVGGDGDTKKLSKIMLSNIKQLDQANKSISSELIKVICAIEGNIGVGKSTFIRILKENIANCEIVDEPVEIWKGLTNPDGQNILGLFYGDIPRWGYSFQNLACITRMMKIEDTINTSNAEYVFLDRSLGTDKHVFEKMLYDNKQISEIEHKMYNLWCDFYYKYIRPELNNIIIYLRCTAETAKDRINKRGRKEEEGITMDYLKDLRKYHEEWLMDGTKNNVIVIDCDRDFESDLEYQSEIIKQVVDGIKNIQINQLANSVKNRIIISSDNNQNENLNSIYNRK